MAYVATVALKSPTVQKQRNGLAVLTGDITVSTYDATKVALTSITSRFKGAPAVLLGGVSSNGYLVAWDSATNSVKAWVPTQQTAAAGNRLGVEAANGDNIGSVPFAAVGVAP